MTDKLYRVRVYSTSSTGSVSHTFTGAIAAVPEVGGSIVHYLEGRTESQPWEVEIVDASTGVTSILAGSDGRMKILNRLADISVRASSTGTYTVLGTGRVGYVTMTQNVASYQIGIEDERTVERRSELFTDVSATTYLYPGGIKSGWATFKATTIGNKSKIVGISGNFVHIDLAGSASVNAGIPRAVFAALDADVDEDAFALGTQRGKFRHLRCNINGTDYEVVTFGVAAITGVANVSAMGNLLNEQDLPSTLSCWLYWSVGQPDVGDEVIAYLHFPTGPVSAANIYHIGGSAGLHPAQVLANAYTGTYGDQVVRYSTAAIATLLADPNYFPVWFRVTEPTNMADWLERNIYQPFGWVPFIDNVGRVAPKALFLSNGTAIPNVSTGLFRFTAANLSGHPTWQHAKQPLVTRFKFTVVTHLPAPRPLNLAERDRPVDGIYDQPEYNYTITEDHDRIANLGEYVREVALNGFEDPSRERPRKHAAWYANEMFDRFGDGPITGTFESLSTGESVSEGDYVNIRLATFPNPATQGRGSTRLIQVLSKRNTQAGPHFEYLDAGPSQQALSSPTIALAASTVDPRRMIKATIGSLSTGCRAHIQFAYSNTTAAPAVTSSLWRTKEMDSTAAVYQVTQNPSGTKTWGRVRALKALRLRSAWANSTAAITTTVLSPPTGLVSSGVTATKMTALWAVASSSANLAHYPVEVLFGQAGGSTGYIKNSANLAYQNFRMFADFTRATAGSTEYEMGLVFQGDSTGGTGSDFHVLKWIERTSTSVWLFRAHYRNGTRVHQTVIAGGTTAGGNNSTAVYTGSVSVQWARGAAKRLGVTIYSSTSKRYGVWTEPSGGGARVSYGTTETLSSGATLVPSYFTTNNQRFGLYWKPYNGNIVDTLTVTSTGGATSTSAATAIAKDLFTDANGTLISAHTPSSGFASWTLGPGLSELQIQSNKGKVVVGSSTAMDSIKILDPQSTRLFIPGLTAGGSYRVGVRHRDFYPSSGVSATTSITFTGGATPDTAPNVTQFSLTVGSTA